MPRTLKHLGGRVRGGLISATTLGRCIRAECHIGGRYVYRDGSKLPTQDDWQCGQDGVLKMSAAKTEISFLRQRCLTFASAGTTAVWRRAGRRVRQTDGKIDSNLSRRVSYSVPFQRAHPGSPLAESAIVTPNSPSSAAQRPSNTSTSSTDTASRFARRLLLATCNGNVHGLHGASRSSTGDMEPPT